MCIGAMTLNCVHKILNFLKGALISSKEAKEHYVGLDLFTVLYLFFLHALLSCLEGPKRPHLMSVFYW